MADQSLPKHVAIIMDGNGRWARKRLLPRSAGHRAGSIALEKAIRFAAEEKIDYLSVFAFSTENWNRPSEEVNHLMHLFMEHLNTKVPDLHQQGIRIQVLGDLSKLDPALQARFQESIQLTQNNHRLTLVICINYSGRWDILNATRQIAAEVQTGILDPQQVDVAHFEKHLQTHGLPDPDLLIRTSGEQRISNFFLWQMAYTELYFFTGYWPDFDEAAFKLALQSYQQRQRRYGKTE